MFPRAILQTLAYFDLLDYPLTAVELWQYFWLPGPAGAVYGGDSSSDSAAGGHTSTTSEFEDAVRILVEQKRIIQTNGFFTLPGRQSLVVVRMERSLVALQKYERALKFAKILRCFPFVRMIAVTNTLALDNAREDSDVDLFFVIKSGRLWTARFFILTLLSLLRVRPAPGKIKDAICACWLVSDAAMDLSPVLLEEDINLHYWTATAEGVFGVGGRKQDVGSIFWDTNHSWLQKSLPNVHPPVMHQRRSLEDTRFSYWTRWKMEFLFRGRWGNWWERVLRRYQLRIMPQALKELAATGGTNVVMNERMLKFHSTDRREEMRGRWKEGIRSQ